jgi:hypothetical protein
MGHLAPIAISTRRTRWAGPAGNGDVAGCDLIDRVDAEHDWRKEKKTVSLPVCAGGPPGAQRKGADWRRTPIQMWSLATLSVLLVCNRAGFAADADADLMQKMIREGM